MQTITKKSLSKGLLIVESAARHGFTPQRIHNTKGIVPCHRNYASQIQGRMHSRRSGWILWPVVATSAASIGYLVAQQANYKVQNSVFDKSPAPYASIVAAKSVPLPRYDTSEQNIIGAIKEFQALLGEDGISSDIGTRIAHSSTQWSAAPHGDLDRPSLVLYPSTTEEVSSIAKICHKRRIPMIPYSGGTSLEGTLAAINSEVCIDFSRMNKIIKLHKDDMDVVVQPGLGYVELNEQLASDGLYFPPDPGPGAQVGGMIAQGCSGTNAFRYGTMKEWVLGLTVVLADGTVIKTRHRPRKSSAGFDLTRLFVGSEGTLGFVTEASLKLTNKPENVKVAVAAFPDVHGAVESAISIVKTGQPLAAMELLDETTMKAVNEGGYCDKEYPEVATLFFKFAGTPLQVREQISIAEDAAKKSGCSSFEFSQNEEDAQALWAARKTALWSFLALKEDPDDSFVAADATVPVSRLGDIIEATHKKIRDSGLIGTCMGHVGDGNFHTSILYGKRSKQQAEKIIKEVQKMAVDMDGTITGEHGVGFELAGLLPYELGEDTVSAMRRIKLALDPLCLLNPGKVFHLHSADTGTLQSYSGNPSTSK